MHDELVLTDLRDAGAELGPAALRRPLPAAARLARGRTAPGSASGPARHRAILGPPRPPGVQPVRIDLHAHCTASDGTDTPGRAGPQRGRRRARRGRADRPRHHRAGCVGGRRGAAGSGLTLVPGAELSCRRPTAISLHLLAYLFDPARARAGRRAATGRATTGCRGPRLIVERWPRAGGADHLGAGARHRRRRLRRAGRTSPARWSRPASSPTVDEAFTDAAGRRRSRSTSASTRLDAVTGRPAGPRRPAACRCSPTRGARRAAAPSATTRSRDGRRRAGRARGRPPRPRRADRGAPARRWPASSACWSPAPATTTAPARPPARRVHHRPGGVRARAGDGPASPYRRGLLAG